MALGLKRNTVVLLPHEKQWGQEFQKEKKLLEGIFGADIIEIQHIGSTAISGIAAKPILDIALRRGHLNLSQEIVFLLARHNYTIRPARFFNPQTHLVFAKLTRGKVTHLLHMLHVSDTQWFEYLNFRDRLNSVSQLRRDYEDLKIKLSLEYSQDRETYTEGKAEFIERVLRS